VSGGKKISRPGEERTKKKERKKRKKEKKRKTWTGLVTARFSNPQWRSQDDNFMNS